MDRVLSASGFARAALLAAMTLVGGAGGTAADPPGPIHWLYDRSPAAPLQIGQFYVGFNLHAGRQNMPSWNSTASIFSFGGALLAPFPVDPDLIVIQPGGEIGYAFRDGTLPPWMGQRVRVAVFGSMSTGERTITSSSGNIPPGSILNVLGVNGLNQSGLAVFGVNATFSDTLKLRRDGFQLGFKLESDMPLGPNLSLTPGIAVFGGRITDKYEYFQSTVGAVQNSTVDERLRTTEFGGHAGARITWQFAPGLAAHLGGTAGVVWMRSTLSAHS